MQAVGAAFDFVVATGEDFADLIQQGDELTGRKIGRAEERPPVGQEEIRHRPAAVAGHALHAGHVNLVDVGILLPVHLHGNEMLVQNLGDFNVVEALDFHDVTPVAGRIADGKKHRFVFGFRDFERQLAPGVPVHRVVGVLQKIRRVFEDQAVDEDSSASLVEMVGALVVAALFPGLRGAKLPFEFVAVLRIRHGREAPSLPMGVPCWRASVALNPRVIVASIGLR